MESITSEFREYYFRYGYAPVRGIIDPKTVARCRLLIEPLFEEQIGWAEGDYLDLVGDDSTVSTTSLAQLLMPTKYNADIARLGLREIAFNLAQDLLGPGVRAQGEHVIRKAGGGGVETPLHQDQAFWGGNLTYNSVSFWIPLQDVDQNNGCLLFAPQSHLGGVLEHESPNGDLGSNALQLRYKPACELHALPLSIGDLSVHHCNTIHGAGINNSLETRYAYILGFGLEPTPAPNPVNYSWLLQKRSTREARLRREGREPTRMHEE